MPRAVDLGVADHGECARREQTAQVAIALLADTAKLVLAPARVLPRHQPDPGGEVASGSEGLGIGDAGDQGCCQCRTDAGNVVELPARGIRSMPGNDAAVELQYLGLQSPQLLAEGSNTGARYLRQPLVGFIGDDFQQVLDAPAPDRGDDPELGKVGADRVDDRRLLADE